MAHTKGKWIITKPGEFDSPLINSFINSYAGGNVCTIPNKATGDEAEANARLIAAAPEMKDLLSKWIDIYHHSASVIASYQQTLAELVIESKSLLTQLDNQK